MLYWATERLYTIIIFENAGILASPHLELTIQIYPTFSIFNNSSIYSTEAPEK